MTTPTVKFKITSQNSQNCHLHLSSVSILKLLMSGLWDLTHRPDQPISSFYEELLCYVAEILPDFEGEILELIIFSFLVTKLREPYRGMV